MSSMEESLLEAVSMAPADVERSEPRESTAKATPSSIASRPDSSVERESILPRVLQPATAAALRCMDASPGLTAGERRAIGAARASRSPAADSLASIRSAADDLASPRASLICSTIAEVCSTEPETCPSREEVLPKSPPSTRTASPAADAPVASPSAPSARYEPDSGTKMAIARPTTAVTVPDTKPRPAAARAREILFRKAILRGSTPFSSPCARCSRAEAG